MSKSLADELAPIRAQIERTNAKIRLLEGELRSVSVEIEAFSADRQRFDALRGVCTALDALDELGAGGLFWEALSGTDDAQAHLGRLRERIARFDDEIRGTQERHDSLKAEIRKRHHELNFLHEEVRQAHAREERRNEELLVEREVSAIPYRAMIMPWNGKEEDEKRFRKASLVALSLCLVFGSLIPLWKLPEPDRSAMVVVPERLVSLVKKEPPRPEPVPERRREEKKSGNDQPKQERTEQAPEETRSARTKAESTGVLAFKETFKDLMEDTPVARLGAEARLVSQPAAAAGQAQAQRSIIAMQPVTGASGGIGNAAVSRNVGGGSANRLGGVGFTRVESAVAGLTEQARPQGTGPGRTDEDIQIVFDRYKATLYRIYNAELRKNPTLRGKIILRITIEPGGGVSACAVQSSDLASPELVARIAERVSKFNFGPKENVPRITILYPIDFLPGG